MRVQRPEDLVEAARPCGATPPPVLFHGTCGAFTHFDDRQLGNGAGHPSGRLGHCLSASPQVAASFAMHESVLERAYDVLAGSKVLLDPSWALRAGGGAPFLAGANVRLAVLRAASPASVSAALFVEAVECDRAWDARAWERARAAFLRAGHDVLLVRGDPQAFAEGELCLEYSADLWIAFEGSLVADPDPHAWRAAAVSAEMVAAERRRAFAPPAPVPAR